MQKMLDEARKSDGVGYQSAARAGSNSANDTTDWVVRDEDLIVRDFGDTTKDSADYKAVAQTYRRWVHRETKWSSPKKELEIAKKILAKMNKKGFVLEPGNAHSRVNRSKY